MKGKRFDKRLDGILRAARVRLMERLRFAFFRGRAAEYLDEIHLAPAIPADVANGKLLPLEKAAADLLEARIIHARRKGYLRSYLAEVHMLDLLMRHQHIQTMYWGRPELSLVGAANKAASVTAPKSEEKARRLRAGFHIVK
ncbi:hypothetical protein [Selenomonas sp.]|uniref:hypothetical protein n=1 Tax=Selenomonas sp. TaxID=2053611 RepID=UPI0025CE7102|nr:hypothetical protein [Selenomonas sp.]MCI6085781.1 hypothetical protein [Selenomonas sp.]MDY3297293.1 hypothetical protein [Selenomonas sp.]